VLDMTIDPGLALTVPFRRSHLSRSHRSPTLRLAALHILLCGVSKFFAKYITLNTSASEGDRLKGTEEAY
jgi:hypothetical protein